MRSDVAKFAGVWVASLLSSVGSALSGFVLGVWMLQTTGSVTAFALVMLTGMLPPVLLGPVAGVIVDRFDRRVVLIAADAPSALVTGVMALLASGGQLATWHVYVATAVTSACGVFHFTAYQAITPLLIPQRHLGRANGLMQLGMAVQIAAPAMAGALLPVLGLAGVLLIDVVTFAVAITVLLAVRLPRSLLRPERTAEPLAWRADLGHGWRYLRARPALLALAFVFTGYNFVYGLAGVLVQPLILSFASPTTLGLLMLAGGSGLFVGSLVMGAWGGPARKMTGISLFMAIGAVALVLHALRPSVLLIALVAPLFLFTLPVVQACGRTIFQNKVEDASLGRVLGTGNALGQAAQPLAYLMAGPLVERLAEPMLRPGGALAGSVGLVTGTGPGRGIAAVFLLTALLLLALAAVTVLHPALRSVETALPDARGEDTEPAHAS
ncbi:MAG TPA: MFS transporter [Pseudonocardia sp.]|nr:MFS transporter [Pseudonocardia sp.]